MMAIWPAGPPNEMNPSLIQKRNASAKGIRFATSSLSLSSGAFVSLACAVLDALSAIFLPAGCFTFSRKQFVEAVENRPALLRQISVVLQRFRQPANHGAESRGLRPVELVVLEVNVMNDLGQLS